MPPKHKKEADSRPDLMALWREATDRLGFAPSDRVCQDIQRLGKVWNDALYRHVVRAMEQRQAERNAAPRMSDRVPPTGALSGEIPVAFAPVPGGITPVCLPLAALCLHQIACGLPGRGKTYFVRRLLRLLSVLAPSVRILLFDPNRSYASLSDPSLWLTLPWADLRLNPLVPAPGYALDRWQVEKIEILCRGELLHSRYLVARLLAGLVDRARRSARPGEAFVCPSLHDLRDALAAMKCRPWSPDEKYRQTALNVLDGRLLTSGGIYDCAAGMEPLVTDTRVRIATDGLSPLASLEFFVTTLIHYVCACRSLAPREEPPTLRFLVVVEEAAAILERRGDAIPFYQEMLLRARSLGVGFLFVTQDISRIDPLVLAGCSNYFIFGQSTLDNRRVIQSMAGLSARETELLGQLEVGECLIRFTGHPIWPHPFLARIPHD